MTRYEKCASCGKEIKMEDDEIISLCESCDAKAQRKACLYIEYRTVKRKFGIDLRDYYIKRYGIDVLN